MVFMTNTEQNKFLTFVKTNVAKFASDDELLDIITICSVEIKRRNKKNVKRRKR